MRFTVSPGIRFLGQHLAIGLLTIWAISVLSFIIIQLPPADFVSNYLAQLSQSGGIGLAEDIARLRADLGFDQPGYVPYAHWLWNLLQGDFGRSPDLGRPVTGLIGERLGLTLFVTLGGLFFAWAFALPVGVYRAAKRGSLTILSP